MNKESMELKVIIKVFFLNPNRFSYSFARNTFNIQQKFWSMSYSFSFLLVYHYCEVF